MLAANEASEMIEKPTLKISVKAARWSNSFLLEL